MVNMAHNRHNGWNDHHIVFVARSHHGFVRREATIALYGGSDRQCAQAWLETELLCYQCRLFVLDHLVDAGENAMLDKPTNNFIWGGMQQFGQVFHHDLRWYRDRTGGLLFHGS